MKYHACSEPATQPRAGLACSHQPPCWESGGELGFRVLGNMVLFCLFVCFFVCVCAYATRTAAAQLTCGMPVGKNSVPDCGCTQLCACVYTHVHTHVHVYKLMSRQRHQLYIDVY